MQRYEAGMLAWSLAGHDKGQLYVIQKVENEYVYLTDGRLKPIEKPKKKKVMHIQVFHNIPEEVREISLGNVKNEEIRKVIRRFSNV